MTAAPLSTSLSNKSTRRAVPVRCRPLVGSSSAYAGAGFFRLAYVPKRGEQAVEAVNICGVQARGGLSKT